MKLLKIILFVFAVYFIRRFIQMYKVMKAIQDHQMKASKKDPATRSPSIDADFKVL